MLVRFAFALAAWFVVLPLLANEGPAPAPSGDVLLNELAGLLSNWELDRKFPSGQTAKYFVRSEWVLHHRFVQMHYSSLGQPRTYEATVLIGVDPTGKRYICHWTDHIGGDFSADGFAPRAKGSNVMEFRFAFPGYALINRFVYHRESGRWTSTIRRTEKGESQLYCEDTLTSTY